ncbi:MAG: hypothetical protein QOC71_1749 [Thermoplasmata archaeon]|nr:hypothetical protein [Thermoplasmata archaeon]
MHKDGNLRKRNALVIPGGLLALYELLGLAYVAFVRSDDASCGDPSLIVFLGACRSALLVLAIPIVIGLAMVAVGVLAFRNQSTCRAGHGSWTHFTLAFLISLVVIPVLGMLMAPSLVGEDATITRGTVDYPVSTVFAAVAGIGLLMLVPFSLLLFAQTRANPCCREKGCFDPCFCDEPAAETEPVEPAPEPMPEPIPDAIEPLPTMPVAPVPPVIEPTPELEPQPKWEPVQEKPAESSWQVVEENPEPETRRSGRSAPALATRPNDPAAPPADAMAVAAKWAEEDEEALHDLEGSDPPSKRRRDKLAKAAKKTAKAKAKSAKKSKK